MATLASDVMARAAALLNDSAQSHYNNTILLPYLQQAQEDLQDEFINNGVGQLREVSAKKDYTALATNMASTLPTDVVSPVRMYERNVGGDDSDWVQMVGPATLPIRDMGPTLVHWDWREGMVTFVGATANREVRLDYMRMFTAITSAASAIEMPLALSFLASRCAQHAAYLSGSNPTRGRELKEISNTALDSLVRRQVRNMPPVRRKRFVRGLK